MQTIAYPTAPVIEGIKGTLLDAAEVRDGIEWNDGKDLWESYTDLTFQGMAGWCAPNSKNLEGNGTSWVQGERYTIYGGTTCKSVGRPDDRDEQVKAAFERGESHMLELLLTSTRFNADTDGRWASPVDITPTEGAVTPAVAVARLEAHYPMFASGVTPTLHLPRSIASLLLGVDGVSMDGTTIRTKLGSKVAAGSGYEWGELNGADPLGNLERWAWASGPVVILRSPLDVRTALDMSNNDQVTLVERSYVVAVEGPVLAIRVKQES